MNRQIVVLKYGESLFNQNYIFKGGNPNVMLPISFVFYLIQDGRRNILIDVGCNDGAGFVMSLFCKPSEALKTYGLMPEDISDVVITHHHHDHIEGVSEYANATVYIQQEEYELGKGFIPDGMRVQTFADEFVLSEGLTIKKIGGHSIGSSIVICNCSEESYVFCGDECYVKACLEKKVATGASYTSEVSEKFIHEYGNGNYRTLLFHDPDILKGRLGFEMITKNSAVEK